MTAFAEAFEGTPGAYIYANGDTVDYVYGYQANTYQTCPTGRTGVCAMLPNVTTRGVAWKEHIGAPITAGKAYVRAYLYFTGQVAQWQRVLQFLDAQSAPWIANAFMCISATSLQMRLSTYTGSSGTSYTISVNTWYRFELDADYDAHTVQGRIYSSDGTLLNTQNASWTPNTGSLVGRTNTNGQADELSAVNGTSTDAILYVDSVAFSTVAQPGAEGDNRSGTGTIDVVTDFATTAAAGIVHSGGDFSITEGDPGQMSATSLTPNGMSQKAGKWYHVSGDFNLVALLSSDTDPQATFTAPAV